MTREIHHQLLEKLEKAERITRSSRWNKFLHSPITYPALMFFNYLVYPGLKRGIPVWVNTFFGRRMKTILPSGSDILLHSTKAHDSEIRMSKYLIRTLSPGDTFIDIGAHFGYYSLMASVLVGDHGKIFAVEASSSTSTVLKVNTSSYPQISMHVAAASDHEGEVTFYEFSGPYAEYNTTAGEGYAGQKWLRKVKTIEHRIPTILLDDLIRENGISKAVIKVDAEGGEFAVLKGMPVALQKLDLKIIMEYLTPGAATLPHEQAVAWLRSLGYQPHYIDIKGYIHPVSNINSHLLEKKLTSDNLVFVKG